MSAPKPPSPPEALPPRLALQPVVRPMRGEDLDAVTAISAASFAGPWSRRAFAAELRNPHSRAWVAEAPVAAGRPAVVGMIVLWLLPPEAEIATFAVHPHWRGRGLGRALLRHALAWVCRRGDVQRVFLEVRVDNAPALALYRAFGFVEVGRRRGYYHTPQGRIDALVMRRPCGLGSPVP